jgi:hypothetical protein
MSEIRWIRYSEQKPPVNERVLVLVNGEIHEGFLHSYVLMGNTEPTIFQTLFTNDLRKAFSAQHTYWGDDPYWMPLPAPKPKQQKRPESMEKSERMSKHEED